MNHDSYSDSNADESNEHAGIDVDFYAVADSAHAGSAHSDGYTGSALADRHAHPHADDGTAD